MPSPGPVPDPMPTPQSSSDEEPAQSTGKCEPLVYEAFNEKFTVCENEARDKIFQNFLRGGNVWDAICASIDITFNECIAKVGPDCWSAQELSNVKNNFIKSQFRNIYNDTSRGRPFIDSCPVLLQNEANMVQFLTGASKCTFEEYEASRQELFACQIEGLDRRDSASSLLKYSPDINAKRSFFVRIECSFERYWRQTCTENFLTCLGSEVKNNIMMEDEKLSQTWLSAITDFEPGFTFVEDCEGLYVPNF